FSSSAGTGRLESLIAILLTPNQHLENTWIDLFTKRTIDAAESAQLDILGDVVGQARGGLSDDVYRQYIRARIAANRSTGKREDLIKIARLILNDPTVTVVLQDQPIATAFVRVGDTSTVPTSTMTTLVHFLQRSAATRDRVVVQSNASIPSLR